MTYAQSYKTFTRDQEGGVIAATRLVAADHKRGFLTETQAIEAMRAAGAYETEIAAALGV